MKDVYMKSSIIKKWSKVIVACVSIGIFGIANSVVPSWLTPEEEAALNKPLTQSISSSDLAPLNKIIDKALFPKKYDLKYDLTYPEIARDAKQALNRLETTAFKGGVNATRKKLSAKQHSDFERLDKEMRDFLRTKDLDVNDIKVIEKFNSMWERLNGFIESDYEKKAAQYNKKFQKLADNVKKTKETEDEINNYIIKKIKPFIQIFIDEVNQNIDTKDADQIQNEYLANVNNFGTLIKSNINTDIESGITPLFKKYFEAYEVYTVDLLAALMDVINHFNASKTPGHKDIADDLQIFYGRGRGGLNFARDKIVVRRQLKETIHFINFITNTLTTFYNGNNITITGEPEKVSFKNTINKSLNPVSQKALISVLIDDLSFSQASKLTINKLDLTNEATKNILTYIMADQLDKLGDGTNYETLFSTIRLNLLAASKKLIEARKLFFDGIYNKFLTTDDPLQKSYLASVGTHAFNNLIYTLNTLENNKLLPTADIKEDEQSYTEKAETFQPYKVIK